MEFKLDRKYKKDNYTIGNLYYKDKSTGNWVWFCNTLEDTDRGLDSMMTEEEIKEKKVYAQTAIPTGTYSVFLKQVSPKFRYSSWAKPYNGCVPRVLNVKGFSGVLIHPGNYAKDTEGCILLGENKVKGGVINSVKTYNKFMKLVSKDEDGMLILKIV